MDKNNLKLEELRLIFERENIRKQNLENKAFSVDHEEFQKNDGLDHCGSNGYRHNGNYDCFCRPGCTGV